MIALLRKTAEILGKNPILWLPYVVAELLSICLWQLRGAAQKSIFRWFMTRQSVLGGEVAVPSTDHSALAKASLVYAPIGLGTIFAVVCVFVVALVVTASLVNAVGRGHKLNARELLAGIAPRWRRILLFSGVFLGAFGVFTAGVVGLSFYVLHLLHRQDLLTSSWLTSGIVCVVAGCTAWLVMPMAIRLLRADRTVQVSVRGRNFGTIVAILAGEAGVVLGVIQKKAEASMILESRWEFTALSIFNSILVDAPFVLLFVALALLAADYQQEVEGEKGSKVRKLVQIFMPMHIRPGQEQD